MEKLFDVIFGRKGEERRIGLLAAGILILVTLLAGVIIFSIFARQLETEMKNGLVRTLNDREKLFYAVLDREAEAARNAARQPHFVRLLADVAKKKEDAETLRQEIEGILISNKLSGVMLWDASGKMLLASSGHFVPEPIMAVELAHPYHGILLWNGQYHLHMRAGIEADGHLLGLLEIETALPDVTALAEDSWGLGTTGEMVVCGALGNDRIRCFPSRHQPWPFEVPRYKDGVPLPLSLALDGQSGYLATQDYRKIEVFDAYKPLGDSGLGMVVKIDASEIESKISRQLLWGAPLLAALVLGGIFLLRWRLSPLVEEVFVTQARLRNMHDELSAKHEALLESSQELEKLYAKLRNADEARERQMDALAEANVRMALYHAAMERVREADAALMSEENDINSFCQNFLGNAMDLTGAKYGAVGLFDGDGRLSKFLTHGITEEEKRNIGQLPCGRGLLGALYHEGKTVRVDNLAADPRSCGFPPHHPPMKSLIGVPLLSHGKVRGAIYLTDKNSGEPFTDNDEIIMDMLVMEAIHILERHGLLGDLRAANRALHREREELQAVNQKLEEAHSQLLQSEKLASIGQLAAGVAHEINNPIGFVHSNLGTLEKYLADLFAVLEGYEQAQGNPGRQGEVEALKNEVELDYLKQDIPALMSESKDGITRVKKIVQDLKDFSHADTSEEWQWANVHKGLDSTLNIVWNEIKYKAEVKKEYGELPDIQCLPSQLNQVFMNILVNAAHAIENRGTITLRTGREGDQVWIEITDTGKGIPAENLKRIFDPFFTTKPVGSGTGLGLSLSYSIVQKHNGRIEVTSEAGKGTAFRVWLPIKQAELA